MSRGWALVTGATSGIGWATAERLAQEGFDLIITGRRTSRLEVLAESLESRFHIKTLELAFDVADRTAVEKALSGIGDELRSLSVLVNNAGLARGSDALQNASLSDLDAMIDTNVKGLLYVTRLCLPHMIERKAGHVVNVGSVAGRWVYPGGATYCASKFAVRALTEGLRMDLMGTPIRVTNIEPGMVETEFSEVRFQNVDKAKAVYRGMEALQATDIADAISWCVTRPPHVNVQELVIYPTDQAAVGSSYVSRK